jgi:hypothetical protein
MCGIFLVVGAALGLWGGVMWGIHGSEEELRPCDCPQQAREAASSHAREEVAPKDLSDARREERERGSEARAAESVCRSLLDECWRRQMVGRKPWPEDVGVEEPGAWSALVDEALQRCNLPVELGSIDCSEYPCVAGIRIKDPALDRTQNGGWRELNKRLRECPALYEPLGWAADDRSIGVEVLEEVRVDCPNEHVVGLLALAKEGPAAKELAAQDLGAAFDSLPTWYRRLDDVAKAWECAEPE